MQHLGRTRLGFEVKAFARGVVVGGDEVTGTVWSIASESVLRGRKRRIDRWRSRRRPFARGVGIAEEGAACEALQLTMAGELGAIVESDGRRSCCGKAGAD